MTRIFEDTDGNEVVDIEFRIPLVGLVTALLERGVLTDEDVAVATNYRIREVTAEREEAQRAREAAEEAERIQLEEATKARTAQERTAAAEFTADPAAEFVATRNKAPDAE